MNNIAIVVPWPDREVDNSGGYSVEEIKNHRAELESAASLLYTDRTKIKLSGYRVTERMYFLKIKAGCRRCRKIKSLYSFYEPNIDTLHDNCSKCREYEEVLNIIKNMSITGDINV